MATSDAASAGGGAEATPGGGALVLLVDDDDPVREVTSGLLHDLGYGVVEAGSGEAALRALDERPEIGCVVLDFAMPGMNGAEVAREVQVRRPGLPVLFASGYADVATLTEVGEERVVRKPFVQVELGAKLAGVLGSQPE